MGSGLARPVVTLLAIACSLVVVVSPVGAAQAWPTARGTTGVTPLTAVALPAPKAAIVVDATSGGILEAHNDRTPVGVASTIKLLTALVVRRQVRPTDEVSISPRAEAMPARKINVKAGQRWTGDALMHAMLLASANDAAVALAEQAGGGSTDGYEALFRAEAARLRLQDHPILHDPAGLDDESSVSGGNLISARDLAVVARAFLRTPDLAKIVQLSEYRFLGGDGLDHRVENHDRFLQSYTGALGLKTGYTKRSGYSLVAAARRSGRTLIAVVIDSPNMYQQAGEMLDRGFLVAGGGQTVRSYLPGSPARHRPAQRTKARTARATGVQGVAGSSLHPLAQVTAKSSGSRTGLLLALAILAVGIIAALVVLRRRAAQQREKARARARAVIRGEVAIGDTSRPARPERGDRPPGRPKRS